MGNSCNHPKHDQVDGTAVEKVTNQVNEATKQTADTAKKTADTAKETVDTAKQTVDTTAKQSVESANELADTVTKSAQAVVKSAKSIKAAAEENEPAQQQPESEQHTPENVQKQMQPQVEAPDMKATSNQHTFKFQGESDMGKSRVTVAGTFNDWATDVKEWELTKGSDNVFTLNKKLPPGRHLYKFVVNGKWVEDVNATDKEADGFGGANAVLFMSDEVVVA